MMSCVQRKALLEGVEAPPGLDWWVRSRSGLVSVLTPVSPASVLVSVEATPHYFISQHSSSGVKSLLLYPRFVLEIHQYQHQYKHQYQHFTTSCWYWIHQYQHFSTPTIHWCTDPRLLWAMMCYLEKTKPSTSQMKPWCRPTVSTSVR